MRKNKFAVIVDKPTLNSGLVKRLVAMYATGKGELVVSIEKPVAQDINELNSPKLPPKATSVLKHKG